MAQSRFVRSGAHEAAEAAQRRFELLRRELAQAGLPPTRGTLDEDLPEEAGAPQATDGAAGGGVPGAARVVPDPGRHARRRPPGPAARVGGWAGDRLPPTLQGRVRLGSAPAALVAVLAAVGLVAASVVVLRSGSGGAAVLPVSGTSRHSAAHPLVPVASTSGAGAEPPPPSGSAPAIGAVVAGGSGTGSQFVVVDVAGKVRRPGVVRLPTGSRVVDALRRAGGARRGVDLAGLNLARVLVDGEQILVGVRQAPGVAAAAAPSAAATSAGQLVNINTATLDGLEALPGVGPVTAQKILDWRTAHGAFSSVDELLEVDGIGEKTLADLAPYVTL
jgi:competence protein ComEA